MKPTAKQIEAVVADFGMLRFFPAGEAERLGVMRLINAMVATTAELQWLRDQMVNHVGEWRGPAELRGVLCAFGVLTGATFRPGGWKPADGVWSESSTPGYTQQDRNNKFTELESQSQPSPGLLGASPGETKALPLSPAAIAENQKLVQRIEQAARKHRLSPPTAADREASRVLLGNLT